MQGLPLIKVHQPSSGKAGPKSSGGRGLVIARLIMRASKAQTKPDRGLCPKAGCVKDLRQGLAVTLSHRQRGGQDGDRGVADMGEMRVVIVQRM